MIRKHHNVRDKNDLNSTREHTREGTLLNFLYLLLQHPLPSFCLHRYSLNCTHVCAHGSPRAYTCVHMCMCVSAPAESPSALLRVCLPLKPTRGGRAHAPPGPRSALLSCKPGRAPSAGRRGLRAGLFLNVAVQLPCRGRQSHFP